MYVHLKTLNNVYGKKNCILKHLHNSSYIEEEFEYTKG